MEKDVGTCPVSGKMPMFVDIPKLVQSPKVMSLIQVPTFVRLKRLHDGDCFVGDTECGFGDLDLCVFRILFCDGEMDSSPRFVAPIKKVVKACSKTVNEITGSGSDLEGLLHGIGELRPNHIELIFQIFLSDDLQSVNILKTSDLTPKKLKMIFRPSKIEFRVAQAWHAPIVTTS